MNLSFNLILDFLIQGFYGVTILIISSLTWFVIRCLYIHGLSRIYKVDLKEKFGTWAVVTGCTEGIGKAYAVELAKRGLNIILISRNINKLDEVSSLIRKCGVQTKIIVADFSSPPAMYQEIRKELQDFEIGILMNNAGIGFETLINFNDLPDEDIWRFTAVNCLGPAYMTKIVLTQMLKRGRGAIVNVASQAGLIPVPPMSIYSASKAFVRFLSKSLKIQLQSRGVVVQTLTPSYVATRMVRFSDGLSKPGIFSPSPETYAANAVRTLTFSNDTSGYWAHDIMIWLMSLASEDLQSWITQIHITLNESHKNKMKSY